ncbi:unnamed protein product [Rotaria sordida]|uniref:Uncharacterized protein n=1 Tax=Rotaria sordida TaxID=392033 RepID=A0A820IXL4_9BILA|nr:unnamed protein product [Rotaria sordida]
MTSNNSLRLSDKNKENLRKIRTITLNKHQEQVDQLQQQHQDQIDQLQQQIHQVQQQQHVQQQQELNYI